MTQIKERGIIYSHQIPQLLDGSKTLSFRPVKPGAGMQAGWLKPETLRQSPAAEMGYVEGRIGAQFDHPLGGPLSFIYCPYGQPGERLYVREAWRTLKEWDGRKPTELGDDADGYISYNADNLTLNNLWGRYRHARHMPQWASRITLEILSVRVMRLQDMTESEAVAAGAQEHGNSGWWIDYLCDGTVVNTAKNSYETLWDMMYGPGSWEKNPWVWAIEHRTL